MTTDPLFRVGFGGREYGYCASGAMLITDPISVSVLAGALWWMKATWTATSAPARNPHAEPRRRHGPWRGIQLPCVTPYVYADGPESLPSAEASIATTSGSEQFKVAPPTATPGIIRYRVYYGSSAGGFKPRTPSTRCSPLARI